MNVIGINGSPRKNGNTAEMLEYALKGAESVGAKAKRIDLFDLDFSGCKSCFACKKPDSKSFGRCAQCDDLTEVLDESLRADALIIGSPIYWGDVTGITRNFMERLYFPGNLYSKDNKIAYEKRIPVGLIYTMNRADDSAYQSLFHNHVEIYERMLGPTRFVTAVDTWQFDDYSKYASSIFDPEKKAVRHRDVFPKECSNAFEMGASMLK